MPLYPQETGGFSFPEIQILNNKDDVFRQYINDVEDSRKRLHTANLQAEKAAEYLTIYQYVVKPGDSVFSLAARCNIPYSAITSLNRLNGPLLPNAGNLILLPSSPGLFVPGNVESELEKLILAARQKDNKYIKLKINIAGKVENFMFFPAADFTPTERAFFLNSNFRFPLKSFRLTSNYGMRANPFSGNVVLHKGLDLAAPLGTEVFAVSDGIVTGTGYDSIYGNYVILSHSGNVSSLYGHLQKVEAVLQDQVKSASIIGRVGSTGQSTGPHLHFELRQNGKAFDPSVRLQR
jgi:murein DD-endopeptidase MepM/ murein hydrolase activator NlpD